MKFPYHEIPRDPTLAFPHTNSRFIPLIPVVLKHGDQEFTVSALADSGASSCLFAGMLGLGLGLDVESGPTQKIYGLGRGEVTAYYHWITLTIGCVTWKEYVGFCFDNFRVDGLLGQQGFFSNFKVAFDLADKTVAVHKRGFFQNFLTKVGV